AVQAACAQVGRAVLELQEVFLVQHLRRVFGVERRRADRGERKAGERQARDQDLGRSHLYGVSSLWKWGRRPTPLVVLFPLRPYTAGRKMRQSLCERHGGGVCRDARTSSVPT